MLTLIEVTSLIPSRILALSRRKSSVRPRFVFFFCGFQAAAQQPFSQDVARWPWRPWGHHLQTLCSEQLSSQKLAAEKRSEVRSDETYETPTLGSQNCGPWTWKIFHLRMYFECVSLVAGLFWMRKQIDTRWGPHYIVIVGWWFQTFFIHVLFSISYMACHPSHWRTSHIFQDG